MARTRAGRWWFTAPMVLVLLAASCGLPDVASGRVCRDTTQRADDCVAWAGFTSIDGLALTYVHGEHGMDTLVRFVLRGTSRDLDTAVCAAGFAVPFEANADPRPGHLRVADLEAVRTASENGWDQPGGHRLYRRIVRGRPRGADDVEVIEVTAFDT